MTSTSLTFDILAKDRASKTFDKIGSSANSSSSHVAKFGAVLKKSAIGIGLVTAAAGVFIAKAGVGYVNSLNQIQALTGANNKQMDAAAKLLEGNASAYAQMGQTTGDAAAGVVELTKSGLSLHDALSAVYGTMTLAKAGALDVADASSITANALNTFHLKAKQAGDVANYLANAANISSADVSDLAESFKYVAPVAASAGVSIKQTNAILAELANAGIKGSQAGTALRTFLLNLQAPAAAASATMKDLGINIYDATGKMKPIGDVIQIVSDKLKGLDQQDRNTALKSIFGKTGISGATTILNEGAKGLEKYTKGIERSGAASKLAQARSKGLAGSFDIVKSSAISGAQTIYRKFSPIADQVIRPLAKKFSDFAENLGPSLDAGFKKLKGLGDKINIKGLGKGLGDQAKAWAAPVIAGFTVGLNTGDWSGLGKALGNGIVKAAGALGSIAGKFADVLGKVDWVGLGLEVGKKAVPFFIGFAAGLLNFDIGSTFKQIMAHWSEILLGVIAIALPGEKLAGKIGELLLKIPFAGKLLSWGFLAMNKFSRGLIGKVFDALKFMGRAFLQGFRKVFPEVGAKFAEHLALFPLRVQIAGIKVAEKGLKMVRGLGTAIAKGIGFVVSKIGELIGRLLKPWADAGSWLVKKGLELLGGLARGIGRGMTNVLGIVKNIGGRIQSAVGSLGGVLFDAGRAVIDGLWSGISSKLSWLGGKLGGVAGFIKDHKGPIEKDRGLLRPAGRAIMDGLMDGISDRLMPLKAALGKVSGLISNMGDKIGNLMSTRSGFLGTFTSDSIFGTDMSAGGGIGSLIASQQAQATQASQLFSDVKQVTKMGLSKALIRQLQSQGTSGAAALHALAMGSPAQIKQLNALNKQTSDSLRSAGLRAGNYVRGGSIDSDIRTARKQEHILELLEHHLKDLAESEKKGQTIIVKIDGEAVIKAVHRRNKRKGVKTAGM